MTTVLDDFDTDRFLRLVKQHRITCVTLIPTMLNRVIDAVKKGDHDISSLRQIYYGSMPTTPSLIRSAYETLGCTFVQGYGVSESCGPIAGLTDEDHRRALKDEPEILRSVGKAFMHAEMSVRDDDGNEVPPGTQGTIWIRSATRMDGYLNLPRETAESFAGAWLKTGDYGHMDGRGYVFLADRKKHMIISGGMNIYPTSVENAIHEHPAVHEVVVVGLPHPAWGQAVVAAVTLKSGARVTPDALIQHCDGRIPRWEIPKHVEIVDKLPQGNTDKLDKRALEQQLLESGHLPWTVEG
jgi:acyl-CoA synthetase (AMP-forming)/AMP-acid ligase II